MLPVHSLESFNSTKIISLIQAQEQIKELKSQGKTIGLCHGGFDVLHPGHIKHFESSKKLCDVLVVSITSDRFVASRKGSGRPIFPAALRAYSIASLEMVDYVVISDFEKGTEVIERLKPSYYIKGPDFIGKNTPGIIAERETITRVGGEMKYTNDPKLSTTEIIEYIKLQLDVPEILLIIDRDGTLIQDGGFFGRSEKWKEELQFNEVVVSYLSYLQTKYKTTKLVISNQQGVARNYFSCARVEEVNKYINNLMIQKGIKIDGWEYCPDVDIAYAGLKKEIIFNLDYIKEETKRKPSPKMVFDGLRKLGKTVEEFQNIVVMGDRDDDGGLAKKLKAKFIDVKGKNYEGLKKEFS